MRVAAVDIGTSSTRLLIAEPACELARKSIVTRLGEGVDRSGRLGEAPQARTLDVLAGYRDAIEAHGCERSAAVMTSAVRDAANGAEFAMRVRATLDFPARTLSGDEEARLTFLGATAMRADDAMLVIDIGGGSTEIVLGARGRVGFHVSTQIGVLRHGERHLHSDPPARKELEALVADVRAELAAHLPLRMRSGVRAAIAVAGTPTQCAAIDLGLERYDAERIEGHALSRERLGELLEQLAPLPLLQLRRIRGMDPARASVIVAGVAILLEVMHCFGLDRVQASERDILWGVARSIASDG